MRHDLIISVLGLMAILLAIAGFSHESVAASAEYRGGSNYLWYNVEDPSGTSECESTTSSKFNNYPIVGNYDQQKALIGKQLATMYANGQRRLRIGYAVKMSTSHMNTANNDLDPQYKENLAAFLKSVKDTGFEGVEFLSGSVNESPHKWKEWQEDEYQKIWYQLVAERQVLIASGLPYVIDLFNEAIPAKSQHVLLQFSQRLWSDYTKAFGKKDTIGFSIITDIKQNRFASMREIYGDNPPNAFDLHLYPGIEPQNAYLRVLNAHKKLAEMGYGNIPWIIGETDYNNPETADDLARGIKETGQRVLWLTQWPRTRDSKCAVNVVPQQFDNYINRGF